MISNMYMKGTLKDSEVIENDYQDSKDSEALIMYACVYASVPKET